MERETEFVALKSKFMNKLFKVCGVSVGVSGLNGAKLGFHERVLTCHDEQTTEKEQVPTAHGAVQISHSQISFRH